MSAQMSQPRPMLAAKYEEKRVLKHLAEDGALLAQPKIDGMRVLHDMGLPRSRSWKLWTNIAIRSWADSQSKLLDGLDGELLPGLLHEGSPDRFRQAQSELRAEDGGSRFTYYVFDMWRMGHWAYTSRLEAIQNLIGEHFQIIGKDYTVDMVTCPTIEIHSLEELAAFETKCLEEDFEGVILRRKLSGYKWNRATPSEGWLTKVKRMQDFEAVIEGTYAWETNNNEAQTNELGFTFRTSHKENKEAREMVGGFNCRLLAFPDVKFNVGVFKGFSHEDRIRLWKIRDRLVGEIITCKDQEYNGGYDKPRTPVLLGFRSKVELTEEELSVT